MKYPRILLFLLLGSGLSQPVLAHGANIDYKQTSAIEIRATYDDGTPMSKAQAVIYAPNDPTTPWLKGVTDESGKFTFVPDPNLSGNWDIKVRQAGHGDLISIPLEQNKTADSSPAKSNSGLNAANTMNYSLGQKWLMAIAIVWGFIGTALFFTRKQS